MTKRSDGRYAEYLIVDGKRRWFYGKTKADVLRKITAYQTRQNDGAPFSEVADAWYDQIDVEYYTKKGYAASWKRAKAVFGQQPIRKIKPCEIAAHIDAMALTFAEKTVATQLSVYNMIFRYGVKTNAVALNPARDIALPSGLRKTKRHAASSEDIARVKASVNLPFGLFAYWLMYTGLRKGELLALTWDDVDVDQRKIYVTKSICQQHNRPVVKAPKTAASVDAVPILDALLSVIPDQQHRHGIVFPNGDAAYMTEKQFYRAWLDYCAASGVTATPHQFRHTYATMLYEANVPPENAQHLLRHSQLSTTMDEYTDIREKKLKQIHADVYSIDIA